jgi:D-alanyl-D-alanine carboxypeptidase
MATLEQLINSRPASNDAAIKAFYGAFEFWNSRTTRGAIIQSSDWIRENIITLTEKELPDWPFKVPYNRRGMPIHKRVAEPLILTWQRLRAEGLHARLETWDGTWVARHQLWEPSNPLSLHSWACALDLNASRMRYGLPLSRVPQRDREFFELWEECGWTWGGRWSPADAMHVQWTDPVPGTPRGLTPLVGMPTPKPPKAASSPASNPADQFEGLTLIVNGSVLGEIDEASRVGKKLYVNTQEDV